MFRKAQAEIRTARQNPRPRLFAPEPQRFIQAARQEKAVFGRAKGGDITGRLCRRSILRRRQGRHRIQNRAIAGAATEIPGQSLMRITAHPRVGIKRHDNARRAKAALRGLGGQHRCLDGMRRASGG